MSSGSDAASAWWLPRIGWTLAGAVLVLWALRLAGAATMFPWVSAVSVFSGLWGLGVAVVAWLPGRTPVRLRWLAWATLAVALVAFGVWAYLQIYAGPGYGTDEMAFDQYAAHLFVHGLDPYRYSMAPAIARYHVSPDGYTYRLNGLPVTTLSYPALAFLAYAPLLALGWTTQAAAIVNVGAWILAVVLLFSVLPRPLRPLAIVLGSLSVYVSYAVGGVTDALFVPLLIGAVVSWDRSALERGWRSWRSPVLMGLALAVKQTPWFVLAFLLAGILLERRRAGGSWRDAGISSGRYLAIAGAVFLVPNVWFIAQDPLAWVQGVLAPFGGHVVPAGQGLIGLSLFLGIGGGSLTAYTVAAVLVLAALLLAVVVTWPLLRGPLVLLPSLVLFVATRSLGSYLVELLPVTLAAAVTIRPVAPPRMPWQLQAARPTGMPAVQATGDGAGAGSWHGSRMGAPLGTMLAAGMAVLALGSIAFALASPSPLRMEITGVHTTGQLATVDRVVVRVRNQSGRSERPHFSIDLAGSLTTFWAAEGGPAVLPPGGSAAYTLLAPNAPAMPPIAGGFQVLAFTEGPDTVSRSPAYLPTRDHLVLYPQGLTQPVAVGKVIKVRAEILNSFEQPVHGAGVPVYLGQIIYDQRGPQRTNATINGSPPGETPVVALTNEAGVATFEVKGTVATPQPAYFEANLLDSQDYYPYGYSPILMIYFVKGTS
ncbi:MAG: hypothetical protein ACYDHB_10915 [Candidatus Dormibacteria bacterium]